MDDVEKVYNEGKLLVRAMDLPMLGIDGDRKFFECQTWADEFIKLMNEGLYSLSTTLIIPGVGVRDYKSIGFLINADLSECTHIAKSDSASNGNVLDGDFSANKSDFDDLISLARYIKLNNATRMNEVNINTKLDAVMGLFINKSQITNELLKNIYVVKRLLQHITGIDYPIYIYDWSIGKLNKIDLSHELEETIMSSLDGDEIFCWPEDMDEPFYVTLNDFPIRK